ncbi:CU044_5270 family protein [Actinoplanes sp. NPDC026670]|uniref:CU044_5270 family protein n=1 Tax=Actinoplanes sp. NPDC026670 TaxID=3154700 RepID=UPI0033D54793
MDELDLLATARPATPPTTETTAAARNRLFDLIHAESATAATQHRADTTATAPQHRAGPTTSAPRHHTETAANAPHHRAETTANAPQHRSEAAATAPQHRFRMFGPMFAKQVTARSRFRLHAGRATAHGRLWGWGLLPLAAAAVALLLVLTSTWAPPDGPGRTVDIADAGPRPPQELRNLLLAAAERTSGAAPAEGRYWVSEVESGTLLQVGSATGRYAIMGRTLETSWYTTRPGDRAVHLFQWAGGAPASDADRAAWQRAGSPSSWPVDEACPASGDWTAGPGATRTVVSEPGASTFLIGGDHLTAAEVRELPTEPGRLQVTLIGSLLRNSPEMTAGELSEGIFNSMINLLYQAPGTPELRAAAYRVLADLPGLRDLGTVTDPKGRTGNAVTLLTNEETEGVRQADTGGAREVRLIFDPGSGQPLAWETRIVRPADYLSWVPARAVFDYEAVLRTGWTDGAPPPTAGALPENVLETPAC